MGVFLACDNGRFYGWDREALLNGGKGLGEVNEAVELVLALGWYRRSFELGWKRRQI